jgi:hypothetical protein
MRGGCAGAAGWAVLCEEEDGFGGWAGAAACYAGPNDRTVSWAGPGQKYEKLALAIPRIFNYFHTVPLKKNYFHTVLTKK